MKIHKYLILSLSYFLLLPPLSTHAAPTLDISVRDFDCSENFIDGGIRSCDLSLDVSLESYDYYNDAYDYYNRLTYFVECEAEFSYTTISKSTGFTWTNRSYERNSTTIYGLNSSSYLTINFYPITIDPIIRVAPTNISCRVTNTY